MSSGTPAFARCALEGASVVADMVLALAAVGVVRRSVRWSSGDAAYDLASDRAECGPGAAKPTLFGATSPLGLAPRSAAAPPSGMGGHPARALASRGAPARPRGRPLGFEWGARAQDRRGCPFVLRCSARFEVVVPATESGGPFQRRAVWVRRPALAVALVAARHACKRAWADRERKSPSGALSFSIGRLRREMRVLKHATGGCFT